MVYILVYFAMQFLLPFLLQDLSFFLNATVWLQNICATDDQDDLLCLLEIYFKLLLISTYRVEPWRLATDPATDPPTEPTLKSELNE